MLRLNLRAIAAAALSAALAIGATGGPTHALPRAINFVCADGGSPQIMIDVDGYFARAKNAWESPMIGRMLKFQCYSAVGRDDASEWIMVPYGSTNAWVHRTAVRFKDGFDITQLPPANAVPAPQATALRLPGVPNVSKRVKALYTQAVKAGRAPGVVAVVGDCNSEHPVFLGRLGAGAFNLAPYPTLQRVAQVFAPSFARPSVATSGSFNAGMAFDPMWANPQTCRPDEGPMACELRQSNASVVLISLGTGDTFTWREFEGHYKSIIDYALANKVVPVLMTKADDLETRQGGAPADHINSVVRKVGAQYGLPVIDFALAAASLPDHGLAQERNVDLQPIDPFHVNEAGMDAKILLTLQTLAQLPLPAAKKK